MFGNGAVLQRNKEIHIWGFAEKGANITVSFAENQSSATADDAGRFDVYFPAMEKGGPYTIEASCENGDKVSSTGVMTGTGYNLYLSDIFIAGNTLEPGTYRSSTSAEPFTFLPGRDYEGTPHGLYLLYVEEDKLQSINVLDSGTMVVRDTTNNLLDLQFTLYFRNSYGGRATYKTHFQGELKPKQ